MARFDDLCELNAKDGLSRPFAVQAAMQQVVLCGLADGGFFRHAAFYGGTCLRLFHALGRFSESLDFAMLRPEPGFSLARQFAAIGRAFAAVGREASIELVAKSKATATESAFVKTDTEIYLIGARNTPKTRVKFEMDTRPPIAFPTEPRTILLPAPRQIVCCTAEGLAVGKLGALLFREWKHRVKGRDWFDFQWLVARQVPVRLALVRAFVAAHHPQVAARMDSPAGLLAVLDEKIATVDFAAARRDVLPFYPGPARDLDLWSPAFFRSLLPRLSIVS